MLIRVRTKKISIFVLKLKSSAKKTENGCLLPKKAFNVDISMTLHVLHENFTNILHICQVNLFFSTWLKGIIVC